MVISAVCVAGMEKVGDGVFGGGPGALRATLVGGGSNSGDLPLGDF